MPTMEEITNWKGLKVLGNNDEKIGTLDEVYVDEDTGRPEWLAVKTGMFGSKVSFVPSTDARSDGNEVRVPFDKDVVKDSPNADADGALSQEEEAQLYAHYGYDYSERGSEPTGVVGHDTSGPTTDDAMTRSEEEVSVGTREVETGRVRLRKHVVTEDVTTTVPVSREEVRIEREPITDANRDAAMAGGEITEEEHEVTLHAEEPVVAKDVVAKERVRLDKDTVTEQQQVDDEVRKERIVTDGDVTPGERR